MKYDLKLDYDTRAVVEDWKKTVWSCYYVYYVKREYFPLIYVSRVERTRKGWHIYLKFQDREKISIFARKHDLLHMQVIFGSDRTRSLFDRLRVVRNNPRWNLFFVWKKGRATVEDLDMKKKMNDIISDIHKIFIVKERVLNDNKNKTFGKGFIERDKTDKDMLEPDIQDSHKQLPNKHRVKPIVRIGNERVSNSGTRNRHKINNNKDTAEA